MKITLIPAYDLAPNTDPMNAFWNAIPDRIEVTFHNGKLESDGVVFPPAGVAHIGVWTTTADQKFSLEEVDQIVQLVKAGYPVNRIDYTVGQ